MNSSPRRRLAPESRRALIEQAAARLFAERGYGDTRLEDIAAAAGVTKPILYRHFASKKAIYLALLAAHREQLPRFVQPPATREPLLSRLPAILDGWFAYVHEKPYAWLMIFRDTSGDDEIRMARAQLQLEARKLIAALLRAQPDLTLPAATTEPLAEALRSAMVGLALYAIDHPETPRSLLVDLITNAARGMLNASVE
jgi:AcrR family transcriptional regulator